MEPCKIPAFASIQKSELADIDIKKPEEGAAWKEMRETFKATPETDIPVLNGPGGTREISCDTSFPIGITVMFFHKNRNRRERVVIHGGLQTTGGSGNDHMFMHLIIAAVSDSRGELLVASEFMFK